MQDEDFVFRRLIPLSWKIYNIISITLSIPMSMTFKAVQYKNMGRDGFFLLHNILFPTTPFSLHIRHELLLALNNP